MAMSSGIRSAADPAPATRDAYIAALTDGRRVFRLTTVAGRPSKLLVVAPGRLRPSFDAGGAQTGTQPLLVEHGCGGRQRNMLTFTEVEQGPPSALAMRGERKGGNLLATALGGGRIESLPAGRVSRHRSDAVRCHICDTVIDQRQPFTGIHHGRWVWAIHEECP